MRSAIERSKEITDAAAALRDLAEFTATAAMYMNDQNTTNAWKELQLTHIMTEVGAIRIFLNRKHKEQIEASVLPSAR